MMCIFHLAFRNWMIESPFPNEGKGLSKICFGGSQINEVISVVVNICTYDVARGKIGKSQMSQSLKINTLS